MVWLENSLWNAEEQSLTPPGLPVPFGGKFLASSSSNQGCDGAGLGGRKQIYFSGSVKVSLTVQFTGQQVTSSISRVGHFSKCNLENFLFFLGSFCFSLG